MLSDSLQKRTSNGKHVDLKIDEMTGDGHIKLSQIKIKNYKSWSRSTNIRATQSIETETITLKESVKVTFYRIREFQSTFSEFFGS